MRVLHLEDSPLDHELTLAHLKRGGLDVQALRIDSEAAFLTALEQDWDVVLSDFNLPGFSGLVALDLLKARGRDIPFILVSGEIGEDTAVEAMRNGASDYLLKNNLARLVPALIHAVDAYETRHAHARADRELNKSKQRLRELAQHLQTSIEHERAAIAREIHDEMGGLLTGLKADIAWLRLHAADAPEVRSKIRDVGLALAAWWALDHERAGLPTALIASALIGWLTSFLFGILQRDPREFLQGGEADAWVLERIAAREAARKRKDFKTADDIRKDLLDRGIVLEDKGGKTTWRRK